MYQVIAYILEDFLSKMSPFSLGVAGRSLQLVGEDKLEHHNEVAPQVPRWMVYFVRMMHYR
jgi:hypothetical protein